jgi:5'-nucleotidase
MQNDRRSFIKKSLLAGASIALPTIITKASIFGNSSKKLTILHTNDVHSRIDAFANDGGKNAGLGGVAARSQLIKDIRQQEEHVLLIDAGDIFQGTPYFNIYKGEPEIKAMSMMGYEASTIGNHDFDGGIDNLAHQLQHANFPLINCNYDVSETSLANKIIPYKIIKKGGINIGILGVGIELNGLVPQSLYGKTIYQEPITKANEIAAKLKKDGCDFVICLSHLGDKYNDNKVSDETLAAQSFHIDLIIGAHTHQLFSKPRVYSNKYNEDVIVNQAGCFGTHLGRLDYNFSGNKKNKLSKAHTVIITKKTNE